MSRYIRLLNLFLSRFLSRFLSMFLSMCVLNSAARDNPGIPSPFFATKTRKHRVFLNCLRVTVFSWPFTFFPLSPVPFLKALSGILVLVYLAGCSARNPAYHDYRLVATATPERTVRDALPATLGVFPVTVPGWLDKKHITWSEGGVRLKSSVNDQWGEPFPELLTQAMVQNLRHQAGTRSWVSSGPWVCDQRPEIVAFVDVHAITVLNHQLRMNVAWSLEGQDKKVIAQREKTYALLLDSGDSTQVWVQRLSRVWGLVAKDMIQAISAAVTTSKTPKTAS